MDGARTGPAGPGALRPSIALVLLCGLLPLGSAAGAEASAAATLDEVVAGARHPWLRRGHLADVAPELRALYPPGAARLLWFDGDRPSPVLAATVRAIGDAAAEGIDPADHDAARLASTLQELSRGGPATDRDRALLDIALSVEWMRLLSGVHRGRVVPPHAGRGTDLPPRPMDLPRLVQETRASGKPEAILAGVAPRYPEYGRLRTALAGQRSRAALPPGPALPSPERKVSPGDAWTGTPAVRARLSSLGDLAPGTPAPADPERLDPALVEAVRRFQDRHGLADDGVIGKGTVAALNVPPAARARQIELAMERWRWLPDPGRRVVVVEIPRAELWAVDLDRGTADLHMRTVVGEARSHSTPMLAAPISAVIFRPYWVPPPKILKQEILPRARANPEWLAGHGMEIVARPEDDAETFEPTDDVLTRVARGELTLRQRPGPRNDLGAVKFVVPDAQCIALHGTPYGKVFELPHRERSHGCIRLEEPDALARWVLRGEPGWDADRIAAAMARERSTAVRLREPVPVVFVYGTASVDPDGTEHYVDDAYHLDARVEEELARLRQPG